MTLEDMVSRVDYVPETGLFFWKSPAPKGRLVGSVAGSVLGNGYVYLTFSAKKYLAARVAWAFTHGEFPDGHVDHIDGDRTNNRSENLRVCSQSENNANSRTRRHNRCGWKGVSDRNGRFVALICKDRKQRYLGTYDTPEQAHEAYMVAAKSLHGEFAFDGVRK